MVVQKTNAMRILDKNKINYDVISYNIEDGLIDGKSVAEKTGQDPNEVYKTLVAQGSTRELYVFVIPVCGELDLKKAAKACGEKKVEMIHVNDILKFTGYIRGGCSPIGMKKLYKTFINETVDMLENVCVSGGKKGLQIKVSPKDLITLTNSKLIDLISV